MVKEVASKTERRRGRWHHHRHRSAEAIFREGLKNVTAGANPMGIQKRHRQGCRGRRRRARQDLQEGQDRGEIRPGRHRLRQLGHRIGEIIADAMDKVGKDGTITVEEAKSIETTLDVVEGMQFDKGYLSPYFRDQPETMEASSRTPTSSSTRRRSANPRTSSRSSRSSPRPASPSSSSPRKSRRSPRHPRREQAPRHDQGAPSRRPASATAARPCCDIAIHRRHVHHRGPRIKLENLPVRPRPRKRIVVEKENTTIVEGAGKSPRSRAGSTRSAARSRRRPATTTAKLQERLAKLAGGVAVINVGAATETEMKEKKARVEDALHATRAARSKRESSPAVAWRSCAARRHRSPQARRR